MRFVKLNNDNQMPIIGLGTWRSKPGEAYQAIRWAIKLGYRLFDCASIYENQAEIGQALADAVREGDIKRSELFVVSKLWNDSHAPEDVAPALDQTLKDLQLEYLDLYLMHWPVAQKKGVKMPTQVDDFVSPQDLPIEATWTELEKLQQGGKVKAIGVSNFSQKKLQNLIEKAEIVPAVNQVENHPLLQQSELVEYCKKNGINIMAYSPLGSGVQSDGKTLLDNPVLQEMAQRLKVTSAQVILAWLMQREIVVIPKSIHEERLKENFAAQAVVLDEADMEKIAALDEGYRFIGGEIFAQDGGGYEDLWDDK